MAVHTKKEFATLCGITTKDLAVYKGRRQVVIREDGFYSDTDPVNELFLQKQLAKSGKNIVIEKNTSPEAPAAEVPKEVIQHPTSTSIPEVPNSHPPVPKKKLSPFELEMELKESMIGKTQVQTRIEEIKEQKLLGMLIPTELVKSMVLQLNKAFISSFKDGAERFLTEISKAKRLSGGEQAELLKQMINIINESSHKTILESKTQMKIIVSQFQEKRGKGEKK